jgi:hypothetical protein
LAGAVVVSHAQVGALRVSCLPVVIGNTTRAVCAASHRMLRTRHDAAKHLIR